MGGSEIGIPETKEHINPDGYRVKVPASCSIGEGVSIHPDAKIEEETSLGDRVLVNQGAAIMEHSSIHDDVIIGVDAVLEVGCIIGKGARIRPGAYIPVEWQVKDGAIANPHPREGEPAFIH